MKYLDRMSADGVHVHPRAGRFLSRTPRWARLLLAIATLALGIAILTRPTTSLGVMAFLIGAGLIVHGATEAVAHLWAGRPEAEGWRPARVVLATLWIAAGVVVLGLPGLTVRLLALIVGVGLIVNGVVSVAAALRTEAGPDARAASAAFGVAGIAFGVLALSWPDITLLVVSVVFGARVIMSGLTLGWSAVVPDRTPPASDHRPGRTRRWARTVTAVLSVALAAGAASVSGALLNGSPVVDEFYAPPRDVPGEPGRLIRAEAFTRGVPDAARGWRILYTTTRGDGSAAVSSGLVVVPTEGEGPWPVVDWAHGTTGFAENCAPSLAAEPFESGALMVLPAIIEQGWAVVATDYIGLGTQGPHPYLIGADSAHATLDAARAARELGEANLDDRTVVWGHSQGGGAALWTGASGARYAPDLALDGVAALAPASNLVGLVANLPEVSGGSVFASFVVAAYTATYDDVTYRAYIRPGAEVTVREMAGRCLAPPGILASVLTALALSNDPDVLAQDPTTGVLGRRLAENEPPATITAPLLIGQGAADSLVIPAAQRDYVDRLCAAGQQVDYRLYAGLEHLSLVEPDSPLIPDLIGWTRDRFDGKAIESRCTESER